MARIPVERRRDERGRLSAAGDAFYGTLRWLSAHVRGFWGSMLAFLSVAILVGVGMVVAFAALADEVMEGATQSFDNAVLTWMGHHQSGALDSVMLEITSLGNFAVVLVMVLVVSVFLWVTRHKYSVALLMMGAAGGAIANNVLKLVFHRARPAIFTPVTHVATSSFPSGHAMMTTILYGSVAYLVSRLEASHRLRVLTWTLAVVIILGVGFSRMYLGVHYPSDIVGGFIAGAGWVALVAAGIHAARFVARTRPEAHEEAEEHEKDLEKDA